MTRDEIIRAVQTKGLSEDLRGLKTPMLVDMMVRANAMAAIGRRMMARAPYSGSPQHERGQKIEGLGDTFAATILLELLTRRDSSTEEIFAHYFDTTVGAL